MKTKTVNKNHITDRNNSRCKTITLYRTDRKLLLSKSNEFTNVRKPPVKRGSRD